MRADRDLKIEITVETDVDPETALVYYQLYRDTFGELETKAVAASCSTSTSSSRRCTTRACTSTSRGTSAVTWWGSRR